MVSYGANFVSRKAPPGLTSASIPLTIRPTLGISQPLLVSWGIRRDLELTAMTSIETNRLHLTNSAPQSRTGGSGLGDSLVLTR
jgi:hypothetical protein